MALELSLLRLLRLSALRLALGPDFRQRLGLRLFLDALKLKRDGLGRGSATVGRLRVEPLERLPERLRALEEAEPYLVEVSAQVCALTQQLDAKV